MCNRHVADMIASYEAARLEAEDESEDAESDTDERDGDGSSREGLLSAVRGRLAR